MQSQDINSLSNIKVLMFQGCLIDMSVGTFSPQKVVFFTVIVCHYSQVASFKPSENSQYYDFI